MITSIRHNLTIALVALISALTQVGCTSELEAEDVVRDAELTGSRARLEAALRGLDDDDLEFAYFEASSRIEMRVLLEPLQDVARGFTIELSIDAKTPDGALSRHELSWTPGDDAAIPFIAISGAELGQYEMLLQSVAIDGVVVEGLKLSHIMRLWSEATWPQDLELDLLAPDTSVPVGGCGAGIAYYGTAGPDVAWGGDGRDAMYGYDGADTLWGQGCGDTLYGKRGNDTLRGGDGWDICRGGDGNDVFHGCEDAIQ